MPRRPGRAIPTGMKADRERFRCSPVFFARTLLFDLPSQPRMVCQGRLGSRAGREAADGHTCPASRRGVSPRRVLQFASMAPSMVSWPLADPPRVRVRRCTSLRLGKQGSLRAGSSCRPGVSGRLLCRRQCRSILAAHELVALACRRFEPRPVNLDRAPPVGSDRARRAELANDMRHRRSPHAEEFRERLLRQRQHVTINPIVDVQQPTRQARLDRVQRIAGRDMLELGQQCPGESLNRSPSWRCCGRAPLEIVPAKFATRSLPPAPTAVIGERSRPQRRQHARGSLIADDSGRHRLAVRHIHDEGDQAAEGEIDPLDSSPDRTSTASRSSGTFSEMRHEQIEVCWR